MNILDVALDTANMTVQMNRRKTDAEYSHTGIIGIRACFVRFIVRHPLSMQHKLRVTCTASYCFLTTIIYRPCK